MTKREKKSEEMNEAFRDKVIEEMKERFKIDVENNWNFLDMRLVTTRVDGQKFTKEQKTFLSGYSEGFGAAMGMVRD